MFEAPSWDERYSALDVGCGEGGDVIWLAARGWTVTGADFSAAGLARAARHAEQAGIADRGEWWQVDARTFSAGGRTWDLVTTHFLHPPDGGMVEVTRRLSEAVAPGGHLLVVGHCVSERFSHLSESHRRTMFHARDLIRALPEAFELCSSPKSAHGRRPAMARPSRSRTSRCCAAARLGTAAGSGSGVAARRRITARGRARRPRRAARRTAGAPDRYAV